jgi:hypothetical protein
VASALGGGIAGPDGDGVEDSGSIEDNGFPCTYRKETVCQIFVTVFSWMTI